MQDGARAGRSRRLPPGPALLVVGAALLLAACSSTPASTGTTVLSAPAARRHFLAITRPVGTALTTLGATLPTLTARTVDAEAQAARPVVGALETLQDRLLSSHWPASAERDVKTLAAAVAPVVSDLGDLATLKPSETGAWLATLQRDDAVLTARGKIVRHDLGLPPTRTPPGS